MPPNDVPIKSLIILFSLIFVVGICLTLPLFKFNYRKFIKSALFIKILFWIPIFIVFTGLLYAGSVTRLAFLAALMVASLAEFTKVVSKRRQKARLYLYFIFFSLGLAHFYLLGRGYPAGFVNLLITLCFATVLSDVAAFFCGNYLGRHKLPGWLNGSKSWEGVAGQLIGAFAGVALVNALVAPVVSLWLFLPLGIGSALGDLANSLAKRDANIKDWSQAIPGHGGFIDRFSSIAGSAALLFWYLRLFN
jgi:phosphatidate cytidylyltransferase